MPVSVLLGCKPAGKHGACWRPEDASEEKEEGQ